jgi:ABC-2 type transport system ATP-binding protein
MAAQGFAMLSWPLSRSKRAVASELLDELDDGQIAALAGGLEVLQDEPDAARTNDMSDPTPMAVDCRHLTYRYGQFTAVDDLTLQVRPGETMGLLGPNGAGKTTVVRMLTALAPVQQGELHIFGMDARDDTADIRCNLGYVPQQLSIEPALTGRQNVEWFARLYGVRRACRAKRVDEALGAMQLLDVAGRLATTYSGGMVRRLEVAQALVNRPSLLVLDEPTVGLDPIARDGVWTQVRNMQAQFGMTVLLTTHYMEEADALCDRVALMHHGVLRAVGTPTELKSTVSPNATLEDVFRYYTASDLGDDTSPQNLREIRSTRKAARRVG